MPVIERSALVPHSAAAMFDVVNDVSRYPDFLPWCESASILRQDETDMVAKLTMARGGMRHSFTTHNTFVRPESIRLSLVDGPFSAMNGRWDFAALGHDGCRVSMRLQFDITSILLKTSLTPVFSRIADTMVEAFCDRADRIY